MSDHQQPPVDNQTNGGTVAPPPPGLPPDPTTAPPPPPPKRQRRPSVRLGDIGDQHTYDNKRTKQHQWKFGSKDPKSSKTRPLVNLTGEHQFQDFVIEDKDGRNNINNNNNINSIHHQEMNNGVNGIGNGNNNGGMIGSWKVRDCSKSKRGFSGTKRVRSNWGDEFENEGDEDDDQSLNFEMDDEMDVNYGGGNRGKEARVRVSDGVELDGPSDTDARNWNNNRLERDGVRVWLNQLGLGRYAPVFEVHEVDDEVLPLLTLEDLKDMGINAVGSRRKMFCSIQKLGKGFS